MANKVTVGTKYNESLNRTTEESHEGIQASQGASPQAKTAAVDYETTTTTTTVITQRTADTNTHNLDDSVVQITINGKTLDYVKFSPHDLHPMSGLIINRKLELAKERNLPCVLKIDPEDISKYGGPKGDGFHKYEELLAKLCSTFTEITHVSFDEIREANIVEISNVLRMLVGRAWPFVNLSTFNIKEIGADYSGLIVISLDSLKSGSIDKTYGAVRMMNSKNLTSLQLGIFMPREFTLPCNLEELTITGTCRKVNGTDVIHNKYDQIFLNDLTELRRLKTHADSWLALGNLDSLEILDLFEEENTLFEDIRINVKVIKIKNPLPKLKELHIRSGDCIAEGLNPINLPAIEVFTCPPIMEELPDVIAIRQAIEERSKSKSETK